MIYGLYLSAAGLQANAYQMDVIANNLANADTTGFKHDLAVMSERRVAAEEGEGLGRRHRLLDRLSGGTFVAPTYTAFSQGSLEDTGRALDLAVDGEGFFQVLDGGELRYTRDGRFTVNEQGRVVTVAGRTLLGANGRPIVLDRESSAPITVSSEGIVRQGPDEVGRLALVTFGDLQGLTKSGAGLFRANGQVPRPAGGRIISGHVEKSTVDPVAGLAQMIQVQRAYQMNATMISLQDGMLGQAVNDLGKVT
jgi:flagellar basal-body rod protein FlgG